MAPTRESRGKMDINDYNTRIAEARDGYTKKAEEIRRNSEKEKADLAETHRAREQSQRTGYDDSLREVEETAQRAAEKQTSRSKEEVERQQEEYNNKMRTAREQFDQDSSIDRNNFSKRLNEIKENYDRSTRGNDIQNQQKLDDSASHYRDVTRSEKQKHNDEIEKIQEKGNLAYQSYRDKVAADKQNLVKQKDEDQHEIVRQNNIEKGQMQSKLQAGMEAVNRAREEEARQMRESQQDQVGQVQSINQAHEQDMIDNYNHLMGQIQQRNDSDQRGILNNATVQLRNRDREHSKELATLERRATAIANNGGVGDEAKLELERFKRASDDRLGRMKNNLEDARVQSTQDKAHMMDMAQETMRQQALSNYKDQDGREKQYRSDLTTMNDKYRTERSQISNQLKGELKDNQMSASKTLTDERTVNRAKYDQQRADYGRRMNVMAEKNLQTIAGIQEEQAREKTDFIEKTKRDLYHAREELKDELGNRFQRSIDGYETKVNNLESDKEKLVSRYEDKLTTFAKQAASEHDQRTVIEEQRRQEDLRTFKKVQEGKDFETAKVVQSLRQEFDKNLNEIRKNGEIKADKLSQRYEEIIERMGKETSAEMHRQSSQAREHYERLAKTSEIEKTAIQNKYELKIQKMKEALERARETTDTRNRTSPRKSDSEEDLA